MKNNFLGKKFESLKYTKLLLSAILAFTLCGFCFSAGCTNSSTQIQSASEQIRSHEYPNTVAENAQISDQYSSIAQKLTEDNISYFLEITKIPHPSEHLDQITSYLTNEYTKLGFSPQVDEPSGSIYVDIPASANFADSPKVIIQSHMDMVPTVANEESGIDLTKQGVNAVYDKESGEIKSSGDTNIGADDGVGMALMLSMAKNYKEFDHPTMRFLYTADEEIGLVGASKLSASVLDCDYLFNYDSTRVGEIIVASAGTVNGLFSKKFNTETSTTTDKKISISMHDLAGGHTADTLGKNIIHSSHLALNCLNELAKNNIEYKISYIKSGTTQNSFPTSLDLQFYIDQNNAENAKNVCENYIKNAIAQASDDSSAKYRVAIDSGSSSTVGGSPISASDSSKLVNGLLKVPDGIIKMSEVNPEIPESSCAMGVLKLENGELNARVKLRSSNNDIINSWMNEFPKIADQAGITYVTTATYQGFPDCSDSKLAQTMLTSYKNAANFEGYLNVTHGGIELSHFKTLRPSMQMVSIGSDIKDEHMCSETYYTKSQAANTASLLYTITHLKG